MNHFSLAFHKKLKILSFISPFNCQQSRKASTSTLFIIHGSDGVNTVFKPLLSKLTCNTYTFPTDSKNYGKNFELPLFSKIVKDYTQEMKKVQPKGPYNIAGYSLGGTFAVEMAIQLEKVYNDKAQNIILLDAYYSGGVSKQLGAKKAIEWFFRVLENTLGLTSAEQKNFFKKYHRTDMEKNRKLLLEMFEKKTDNVKVEHKETLLELQRNFESIVTLLTAVDCHAIVGKHLGNTHFVKPKESHLALLDVTHDKIFQQFCAKPITSVDVQGDHYSFLFKENVQETAQILNTIMESKSK